MEEFDHDHHVKLVVDEWGPWYRPGSEATPGDLLEQTPTLRDAVFSAMTLDIFNRHPEKIAMANCAQLINCLNSLYLAHEDRFVVTPVGYVFEMYAPHQGGQAVRTMFSSSSVHYGDFHHMLRSGATLSCVGRNSCHLETANPENLDFHFPNPHLASVITLKPVNCFPGLHHSLPMLERCFWSSSRSEVRT